MMRIGHGFDVHKFGPGDHIILGGVRIPHTEGLIAHSDGDVLIHAVCDALLGALGAGDIGHHFPDTDPRYKGIDSTQLLNHVHRFVVDGGWQLVNLDATIVAQRPKMAPYIPQMCERLAGALGAERTQINVKATTTEGLGFTGRGEGIAVHSVVLLQQVQSP